MKHMQLTCPELSAISFNDHFCFAFSSLPVDHETDPHHMHFGSDELESWLGRRVCVCQSIRLMLRTFATACVVGAAGEVIRKGEVSARGVGWLD